MMAGCGKGYGRVGASFAAICCLVDATPTLAPNTPPYKILVLCATIPIMAALAPNLFMSRL